MLSVVRRIPPGRVATYGDVARLAGRPRAARAVGNIMRGCNRPDVPCHRVIAAGGRLGGYGGQEALKRSLLVAEGVPVAGARARLARVRWRPRMQISSASVQHAIAIGICNPQSATPATHRGTPFARGSV